MTWKIMKDDLKNNFKVRIPPKRYHGRGAVTKISNSATQYFPGKGSQPGR